MLLSATYWTISIEIFFCFFPSSITSPHVPSLHLPPMGQMSLRKEASEACYCEMQESD
jgi:hypothetical protein